MDSNTLLITGVKEIGLRSLPRFTTGDFLGTGMTSADLHILGMYDSAITGKLLKMELSGAARVGARSRRSLYGIS